MTRTSFFATMALGLSFATTLVAAAAAAGCTWAPEAIYDEEAKDHVVYWASPTGSDHKLRIWAAHTKDFEELSKPEIMAPFSR